MEPRRERRPEDTLERNQKIGEVEGEALETVVGAAAGAITGALAGPIGIAAGAAIGAVAGAVLGHQIKVADRESAQHERDLDAGIVDEPVTDEMPGESAEELDAELEAMAASQAALEKPVPFRGTR